MKQKMESERLKTELDHLSQESLEQYEGNNKEIAQQKMNEFNKLLDNPKIPENYRAKVKNQFDKQKQAIENRANQEKMKDEILTRQKEEDT